MKNLILLPFVLVGLTAFGQNDSILPNSYAHYTVQRSTGPFEYQRADYEFYSAGADGDTMIVRSTDYSQWGNDTVGYTIDTLAYIAMDGYKAYIKKIKFYSHWMQFDEEVNDWEILYDFSLQIGDTACANCYSPSGLPRMVTSVDTIYIQGVPRKVLQIDGYLEWVQGMGSTQNPLMPMISYFEISEELCGAGMVYSGPSPIDSSYYHPESTCYPVNGVGEEMSWDEITLSPNPAGESIFLRAPGLLHAEVVVYDLSGRIVYQGELANERMRIPTAGFAPGMYLVHVHSDRGSTVGKIIVE